MNNSLPYFSSSSYIFSISFENIYCKSPTSYESIFILKNLSVKGVNCGSPFNNLIIRIYMKQLLLSHGVLSRFLLLQFHFSFSFLEQGLLLQDFYGLLSITLILQDSFHLNLQFNSFPLAISNVFLHILNLSLLFFFNFI